MALLPATGMERTATFSVSTDVAEASRFDATYPPVAAYTVPTDFLSDFALDAREPTRWTA